jgi:hypothetical protein
MVVGGQRHALTVLRAGKRPSTRGSVGPWTRLDGYGKYLFQRIRTPDDPARASCSLRLHCLFGRYSSGIALKECMPIRHSTYSHL